MIQAVVGTKVEQTQRFLNDGTRIPVTVVSVSKLAVTQIKTVENDGYSAVQVGYGTKKNPSKPLSGHIKKASLKVAPTVLREVKLVSDEVVPSVGDILSATDALKAGDIVRVIGTGKGKGFQGGVKRYNFRGGPKTHGQSDRHRAPGSIGSGTTPGRVYRGKKMAGHMGTEQVTVKNLVVVDVNGEQVLLKGLIPGVLKSTVIIEKTGELKNPLELYIDPSTVVAEVPAEETTEVEAAAPVEEAKATPAESSDEPKKVKSEEGAVVPPEKSEAPKEEPKAEEKEEK